MFNASALLLDDTLKATTPLTNGAISEMLCLVFNCHFYAFKPLTFHKLV